MKKRCFLLILILLILIGGTASASADAAVGGALTVLVSLSMLGLVLCAIRGAKQWGI